jgi:hypothetical protein
MVQKLALLRRLSGCFHLDGFGNPVTNFYVAYNLIPGRHQRCWSHLLRDLHELKQKQTASAEVAQWVTDVRREMALRQELYVDGGLIIGPTHAIQPLTPVENVVEMYRATGSLNAA